MANDIIPQDLIIYRRILTDSLNNITNEMYANNIKTSYKYSFTILPNEQKPKHLLNKVVYVFKVFAIDKSKNIIGETHYLYNTYHTKDITTNLYSLEREAIQAWFTTASKALYNHIHTVYMDELTAKENIKNKIQANGATEDVVKEIKTANDKVFVANREQAIMDTFNMSPKSKIIT